VTLRGAIAVFFAAALPMFAACAGPPAEGQPVIAAVIVKPRSESTSEAVLRVAQDAMSPDAGVRYVRPMAGGAHILYLTGPATRDATPALLERLKATGAFEYVEIDTMMKAR